ncbi:hypothetical protein [Mycolicibacterium iranicum]|uniref:Uncharacterized protein n=1 Tax=Mycolicibacterium iranicum TaxID=912594 RepID=A0ABT4HIE1_MYCIR|nr:hypothetical protein [Mycolicibacterium iranicum]MCZ0729976.1 hypothetical protein [Mycolicibacterium iranicum]
MTNSTYIPGTDVRYHFCSEWDGALCIVVDERDIDLTGWLVEIEAHGKVDRRQFTRKMPFFCVSGGERWNGIGGGELRTPWSAVAGFGSTILRWLPPDNDPPAPTTNGN